MKLSWKNVTWVVLLLAGVLFLRSMKASTNTGRITSVTAHQLVSRGALLVDVRTPAEFATQHLPGALNVPLQELATKAAMLEPKTQDLVLYCRSGHRSGLAVEQLRKAGFTKLHDLGPMTAY